MKITEHKPSTSEMSHWQKMNALVAVFDDTRSAHEVAGQLVEHDFPMDQISVLHRPSGQTDDFLGVSYQNERERTKIWAENGGLWGALVGLAVGASGLIFVPSIGPLLVLGPVIDTIAGAALGAGVMAEAANVTRLTAALHRLGIPEEETAQLHQAIMDGKTMLILHYPQDEPKDWLRLINWDGAKSVQVFHKQSRCA